MLALPVLTAEAVYCAAHTHPIPIDDEPRRDAQMCIDRPLQLGSAPQLAAAGCAISDMVRYGFTPPRVQGASLPGLRAARERCLRQRGWRVVRINIHDIAIAAGSGRGAPYNRTPDTAALEALLRRALEL